MKNFICTALVVLLGVSAMAQTGREFWFSIPYVDKSHDADKDTAKSLTTNYFRVSTGEIGAVVTFYQFLGGTQDTLFVDTINANSVSSVTVGNDTTGGISHDIKLDTFVINKYGTILDRGIFISSTSPISIYYEVGSPNNTELFALKGSDALGTQFYPILQNAFPNKNDDSEPNCEDWALDSWTTLDIVATANGTTVTIDMPTSHNAHTYDTTLTRYVGQFKVYNSTSGLCVDDWSTRDLFDIRKISIDGTLNSTDTIWLLPTAIITDGCSGTLVSRILGKWISGSDPYYHNSGVSSHIVFTGTSTTTITLNKGNVYSIKAETQDAVKLLGGVKITSTSPVAIVMKDDGVFDGSCGSEMAGDLVGDQIVPTSKAGTAYIIPDYYEKINSSDGAQDENLFIRALENGTKIKISGETDSISMNDGDVLRYSSFSQDNTYKLVTSNAKPFQCYHMAGLTSNQSSVTEFAGACVPPVDSCTGSTVTAFVRPQETTFRPVLISRTNTAETFKYFKEGSSGWTDFSPTFTPVNVSASNTWYIAVDSNKLGFIPEPNINYLIKNTGATFHFGFLQKRKTGDSHGAFYGYFSDFSAPELLIGFMFVYEDGQYKVKLSAVGAVEGSYDWDLISPSPVDATCAASYFSTATTNCSVSDCDNGSPITLASSILSLNGLFNYKCTGQSTCSIGSITNNVYFEVESSTSVVLPVELHYFKVHCVEQGTMLEWATLSETNNTGFDITRSYDGENFQAIGYLPGQGTSSQKTYYTFTDTTQGSRMAYYQLVQTDIDGGQNKSKIASLECEQATCGSVYPTLCREGERINIVCENGRNRLVRILSISGIVLLEKSLPYGSTQNSIQLTIPKGVYVLQIIEGKKSISQQQIIVW